MPDGLPGWGGWGANRHAAGWGPSPGRGGAGEWPWRGGMGRQQLFLFFATAFGLMALSEVGGMAVIAHLVTKLVGAGGHVALIVLVAGIVLALALPVLALTLGLRAFRTIAAPLAEIVRAAAAVAKGDLTARVAVSRVGLFRPLAASFNRMVGAVPRTEEMRRRMTADVAQELHAPLQISSRETWRGCWTRSISPRRNISPPPSRSLASSPGLWKISVRSRWRSLAG